MKGCGSMKPASASMAMSPPFSTMEMSSGGSAVFQGQIWLLGGGTYDTPTTPTRSFYNDVWSSADGVHWSEPVKLLTDYAYQMHGKSMSTEPTVLFDDRAGRTGWLVYQHSPKWWGGQGDGVPHFMVGRRIAIHRAGP